MTHSNPNRNLPLQFCDDDLISTFRKVYYYLYSNSNSSRAETLLEDLSLILLAKFAIELKGKSADIQRYLSEGGRADMVLLPLLRQSFPDLMKSGQKLTLDDESIYKVLTELDHVTISTAPAHVLGEAFQALIGPKIRGDKGQFFTPLTLVRAMVEIIDPQPNQSALDPACGTGTFLAEVHSHQSKLGKVTGSLVGIDKDAGLFRIGAALLHIITKGKSTVCNFNSLDGNDWERLGSNVDKTYDIVLTNPPFGARIGIREPDILRQFDLGHQWILYGADKGWHQTTSLASSQDP